MAGGHRDGEPERLQYGHENEIVVAASDNGRTSYQDAGRTRRRGVELGWDQQFAPAGAQTGVDAAGCDLPVKTPAMLIQSGNRIPGIARNSAYALALAGCRKRIVRWR